MNKLFIQALLLAIVIITHAQDKEVAGGNDTADYPYWIEMMQDRDANFYETQRAFNLYWSNREIVRGSGWKPFKRWEHFMKTRVDEFGNKPDLSRNVHIYNELMQLPQNKKGNGNWEILGPINLPNPESGQPNGMGRINAIAFHPFSQNTIYIGAPSGGFWRSTDNGATWETTTDRLSTLGVSAIAVNPVDPNIIYIGTGDRDAGDAPGLGVYKSFDGGTTWIQKTEGMGEITVNMMLVHPNYTDVLIAATENGIYKSVDGGESWVLKSSGTSKSIVFNTNNADIVYAIKSSSFYRSTDNGETWIKVSNGLSSWSRAVVAVTPANSDYVYVMATTATEFKGLYLSTNGGESFTLQSTTPNIMGWQSNGSDGGGQAWYDLCISADPIDPKIIYTGGVNIWKSKDSGKTWKINAHWVGSGAPPVHADHHDMAFNPLNNRLYTGNDGGLYYTDNGGTSWINISSGISISQIYKIGQSATKRNWVLCGNQDNGTSYFKDNVWSVILGGDGMECLFDHTTEKYKYGELYYGSIYRSVSGGSFTQVAGNGYGAMNEDGAWVTPYILNQGNAKVMYVGMKNIWRTTNVQASSVVWSKITSGIANTSNFVVLESSPVNPDILYAAREDKSLYRTLDVTATSPTWTKLSNFPSSLVTDIVAHPTDENIVYATASNYSVYKSADKGTTWTKINQNLPQVNFTSIAFDKTSNEGLYVGTDIGVFYKDATMPEWVYFSNGLPATTEISELEIYYDASNPENNAIRASTYGRGLWGSSLYKEAVTQADNARFLGIEGPKGNYSPSDSIQSLVTVKNIGINFLDTLWLNYQLDNQEIQYLPVKVGLETYQTGTIELPKFVASAGTHAFKVRMTQANQTEIQDEVASAFSVTETNWIQVQVTTDSLANETSWKLIDANETVLLASSGYLNDSVYSLVENIDLATGCYKFVITDANGICCTNGNGSFQIVNQSIQEVLGGGAEFTGADTVPFCVDTFPAPDFKASKTSIAVNQVITFENKTVDNGYTYYWSFGEDAVPAVFEGITPSEVSYTSGGAKSVSLKVVNNQNADVKTLSAYINVYDEPVFTLQPVSVELCPAEALYLEADAKGYGLSYKWYFNGNPLSNQTDKLLSIENIQEAQVGSYYCKVSNSYFNIISDTVEVTLKAVPELTVTTSADEICKGSETTLTASGTGTFEWSNSLGTEASVTVIPTQSTTYFVSLTNGGCTATQSISILVAETPSFTAHPANKRVCEGQSVNFLIQAKGFGLNYQWKVNGQDFESQTNSLYIDSVQKEFMGDVVCIATNVCGSTTSNSAYLTVDPLPVAGFTVSLNNLEATFADTSKNAQTYNWEFGDGATSTMIAPTHTYALGTYYPKQQVTNDCGTDTISMKVMVINNGVDDLLANESLATYPNPNNGQFQLNFTSEVYNGTIQISILNIEGRIIQQFQLDKNSHTIEIPMDVTLFSAGVYQIQIALGNRMLHSRIVVNN